MMPEEIGLWLAERGQAATGRADLSWLSRGAESFAAMSDIGLGLRRLLETEFYIDVPEIARKQMSRSDGTVKYLWRLADGNRVESVVMRYMHGNSACISTQAGCRMGVRLLRLGRVGFVRNLTPSEMLDQVIFSGIGQQRKNIERRSDGHR
jgi:23S rRNA (adenine2503-C2)-methyltransferase